MAYDKLVDSAKLDGALTATADAIRAKTSDAAPITWDADDGFAAAVEGIEVTAPTPSAYDVQSVDNGDGTQTVAVADIEGVSTGDSIDTETPISAVKYNGQELPMQGAVITDGIIVKARDADGWATEVDLYCADGKIPNRLFVNGNENNTFGEFNPFCKLTKVNLKTLVTDVGEYAFAWLASLSELDIDFAALASVGTNAFRGCAALHKDITLNCDYTKLGGNPFRDSGITGIFASNFTSVPNGMCQNCATLKTAYFPKVTRVGIYTCRCFLNCTALEAAEFGSVGYPVTGKSNDSPFVGCTQTGLTITAYVKGDFADTLLANFRDGATNATIILKAAEDTTYNDVAFAAGDTILTSEVATE